MRGKRKKGAGKINESLAGREEEGEGGLEWDGRSAGALEARRGWGRWWLSGGLTWRGRSN